MRRKKYMAVLVAAVLAAAGCALEAQHAAKSGDAPKETQSAYERQDPAELAETLSTMHMTEALQGMAAQHAGKDTVMDLWAYANAKLNLAAAEPDPAVARRLIDDAVAALGKLVDRTSKGASDEEVVSNMEYRLALVDACGACLPPPRRDHPHAHGRRGRPPGHPRIHRQGPDLQAGQGRQQHAEQGRRTREDARECQDHGRDQLPGAA